MLLPSLLKRKRVAPHERRPKLPERDDARGAGSRKRPLWAQPRFLALVGLLVVMNWVLVAVLNPPEPSVKVPYSPVFLDQVRAGNVERINSRGAGVTGEFHKAVTWPRKGGDSETATKFETQLPAFTDEQTLERLLIVNGVEIDAEPISLRRSLLATLLLGFGPVLVFVLLLVYFIRRGGGGMSAIGSFGRSRARRFEPAGAENTFADVAGIEEAKDELTEVVDFLKNPDRYQALGGRIPRGVLLTGQPGTGKTLLARAVAGEAGVPFFSSSASEFVEAVVGVGAARVRDTFKNAKEAAPAILFIDELDAVGRQRSGGAGFGAGSDEREQTLNQILTEMDGFDSNATVIVLAATNRPETLDSALLRPGRFDRRVTVPAPDLDGRRAILEVHTRSLPIGDDVDLARLASITPGMVGADLANLCNEAALMAARRRHEQVLHEDFTDALEKIILGAPRTMVMSEEDRRRTAFHESGHAIVGMLTPGADPVRKISIIPRGRALGVTFSAPDFDRVNYDRAGLFARLDVAYAGRVAEEVVFDDITTGAENDIEQVTQLARSMVGRWGMSERVGFLAVIPRDGGSPLAHSPWSDATREAVDAEVRRIVDDVARSRPAAPDRAPRQGRRARPRAARARDARPGRRVRGGRDRAPPGGRARNLRALRGHGAAPRGHQPQRAEDRPCRGRAVQRVEVDARRAVGEQVGALERRVGDAEVGHGARLVAAQLELAQQPVGDVRAAHLRDPLDLAGVRDRHDARDDRDLDPDLPRAGDEVVVALVVEEELRDQEARSRVDLRLEVAQVALGVGRMDVHLGEARRADREVVLVADQLDQLARVAQAAVGRASTRSARAAGRRAGRGRSRCPRRASCRGSRAALRSSRRRT